MLAFPLAGKQGIWSLSRRGDKRESFFQTDEKQAFRQLQ